MVTLIRRGVAAVAVSVLGAMFFAGPATAAPPTSSDETVSLHEETSIRTAAPGGYIAYVIETGKRTGGVAQNRTVVLELPDGVTYRTSESYPTNGVPCVADAAKRTVTCKTKEALAFASWRVETDVAAGVPQGDYITTKATLTTEIPDPQPANNVAALKVFITAGGEVSVAVQAPKGPWQVGSKFDATFSIHNAGPYRTPVRFHSGLLRGLRSDGWPKGCTAEHGQMWCYDFIVIDAGKTFSFTVHFEVGEYDKNGARLNPQLNLVAPDADLTNNEAAYRAEIIKPSASPTPTGGTGGGGPTLPITGTATTPLALAGLVLLLAGAAAILLTRRRVRKA
ncbi:LPXTG cell wall anchor domain-containing protein [Amorphoplanes digitatis]|uniref:LPXTG-motif cell wall-anchored protein n=1 Tax=Actinoplanes digitatis TaxID=1868 RepID=A0A7W7I1I0_9ACTN|nr:LPXTG cell wall anchor domain-containing protein [Actinoplanes digitatis]MBB4764665.1 LPXTG-motif cell wall-anchored protein [Actinoplanes digitatis]GID91384.1 hypothetical protein Adi01nite_07960 [Actinoplanes digitatis]